MDAATGWHCRRARHLPRRVAHATTGSVGGALGFELFITPIFLVWRVGGLMVLGMGLYAIGVFSATRTRGFYLAWCAAPPKSALPRDGTLVVQAAFYSGAPSRSRVAASIAVAGP
jgi:hypothetical protein